MVLPGRIRFPLGPIILAILLPVIVSAIDRSEVVGSGGLQELMDVQKSVKNALPMVRPAVVALETRDVAASGVIVTPDGLILTAAHVICKPEAKAEAGLRFKIILSDGRETMGTALGMDTATDAAMIQIDGSRSNWPFVDLNRNAAAALPGHWCFALGHPGGYDENRGDVLRVGKVLKTTANSLQTDCVLMGGDSGGPLFSITGALIGIHSQISEGRDQNVHVSL
ncbi:MAG: hypothetical protein JWO08_3014, partial [Verrucomicrobiaceae bacterium]|nr:hypothetical protein [Verrucomicrobiaceae bacterium]